MLPESTRRGVRFNAEINLGHILTACVMIASIMTVFLSVNSRLTILEVRLPALEKSVELMLQSQRQSIDQSIAQMRALDRLTVLVEERKKP